MNLIKNYYNKEIFQILLISFIIFFLKWFFSYWNFGFENIYTKIIFNPSGDFSYYPFVKQFADLNFSEGYSSIFQQLNLHTDASCHHKALIISGNCIFMFFVVLMLVRANQNLLKRIGWVI